MLLSELNNYAVIISDAAQSVIDKNPNTDILQVEYPYQMSSEKLFDKEELVKKKPILVYSQVEATRADEVYVDTLEEYLLENF